MDDHSKDPIARGEFLKRSGSILAAMALGGSNLARFVPATTSLEHPEPRPDITAERVLSADALPSSKSKEVLAAYDGARAYPSIFDGIACGCGCSGKNGMHRSLLVCYETLQPTGCHACQQEAELVARLAKQETGLVEIRAAVDKKFG
jgi:hypothetical protein